VHPLVSNTHRAASADAVAGLALASENEQRGWWVASPLLCLYRCLCFGFRVLPCLFLLSEPLSTFYFGSPSPRSMRRVRRARSWWDWGWGCALCSTCASHEPRGASTRSHARTPHSAVRSGTGGGGAGECPGWPVYTQLISRLRGNAPCTARSFPGAPFPDTDTGGTCAGVTPSPSPQFPGGFGGSWAVCVLRCPNSGS
jgi:hypothetical protein